MLKEEICTNIKKAPIPKRWAPHSLSPLSPSSPSNELLPTADLVASWDHLKSRHHPTTTADDHDVAQLPSDENGLVIFINLKSQSVSFLELRWACRIIEASCQPTSSLTCLSVKILDDKAPPRPASDENDAVDPIAFHKHKPLHLSPILVSTGIANDLDANQTLRALSELQAQPTPPCGHARERTPCLRRKRKTHHKMSPFFPFSTSLCYSCVDRSGGWRWWTCLWVDFIY